MEENKNQRAVEQRLRDALHFDRARVQMGKISRFGLMELSRQRLRPSLSEGSHITCPRCNGTGVIRDAESSALQILRLLQEEAMKENTAALHAQVPVDVATFLLNEKRNDISKIEARFKINVVLIPNKTLETPHHAIERLRHDDPKLEEIKPSFELATSAEDEPTWVPNREREAKPRPEALVKGITPSQPAPGSSHGTPDSASPAPAVPAARPGVFKSLINWLTGTSSASDVAANTESGTKESEPRTHQGSRPSQQREQGRNGNRRRRRNEPRSQASEDSSAGTVRGARGGQRRSAKTEAARATDATQLNGESRNAETVEDTGSQPGRNNRNRRGRGRNRRNDATQSTADAATAATVAAAAADTSADAAREQPAAPVETPVARPAAADDSQQPAGQNDQAAPSSADTEQADPERKRRRRRSRRGRKNTDGSSSDATSTAGTAAVAADAEAASAPAPDTAPVPEAPVAPEAASANDASVGDAQPEAQAGAQIDTQADTQADAQAEPAQVDAHADAQAEPIQAVEPVQAFVPHETPQFSEQALEQTPAEPAADDTPSPAAEVSGDAPVGAQAGQPASAAVADEPVDAADEPADAAARESADAVVDATADATADEGADTPEAANNASVSLQDVVASTGLQWVETKAGSHSAPATPQEPVRLGRPRKAAPSIAATPLEQIETEKAS
jgi:ribonuclease E